MLRVFLVVSLIITYSFTKRFTFSIVMALFNTARYLDYSIGSLINQTIGIKNIQIILINDGSIDETEEKCLFYQDEYPNNIIYIKLNHSGVSKARNIGLRYVLGKYINFFDSDDIWGKDAFHYVLLFFKFHQNINIVGCRLKFFEAKENYHPLDYKFYKTRVANLTEELYSFNVFE